jgi:hypothetical protein
MNFKDMLAKMSQLSEATEKTKTGLKHTAEPGGYGRKDDEDEEGNKVKQDSAPRGRGRPKKDADASGEVKKYDTKSVGDVFGGGKKPEKEVGKVSKKHSLKEYFDQLDQALLEGETIEKKGGRVHKGTYGTSHEAGDEGVKKVATQRGRGRPKKDADETGEVKSYDFSAFGAKKGVKLPAWDKNKTTKHTMKEAEQIQIKPASQMPKQPGQSSMPGQQQQVAGQPQKNTQVIAQGNKTLGTVDNPQLAQQIKQSIGKGEMTLMPEESMEEGLGDMAKKIGGVAKKVGSAALNKLGHGSDEDLIRDLQRKAGMPQTGKLPQAVQNEAALPVDDSDEGAGLGAGRSATTLEGKDEGKPGKNFAKIAKSAGEKYGSKAAGERVAGAVRAKLAKQGKLEETAKPDFLDVDKDGDEKESFKKAVKDKKKVKEGMDHRLKAAHHAGKSHALSKQGYNCAYDDMEEARQYHEGYKQGLDECYGQMPMEGVGQEVEDMASYGAHTPEIADEGNAFTGALAKTPAGGKFSVGGKTFTDRSAIEEANPFSMSESFSDWDKELNALLEGKDTVAEGMSVSISKGNEGSPDSVSVTAQDGEADQLLSLLKSAGMGLFGGDEPTQPGQSSPMSVAVDGEPEAVEIGVVDDHDGMMDLIKKVTGSQPEAPQGGFVDGEEGSEEGSEDYADEEGSDEESEDHGEEEHEHEHTNEETCNECGMMECECEDGKEVVDEVESEDQMEYEVAEDAADNSGATETEQEDADVAQANQSAAEYDEAEDSEQVTEWANDAGEAAKDFDDESFQADMDFMTKVISGGLNKQKSTGQSTIPVVASQASRLGNPMQESANLLTDWKALAGIK